MDGVHNNYCLQAVWGQNTGVLTVWSLWTELSKISLWSIVFMKPTKHQSSKGRNAHKNIIIRNMVCGHHSHFQQFNRGKKGRVPMFTYSPIWKNVQVTCTILQWMFMNNEHNPGKIFLVFVSLSLIFTSKVDLAWYFPLKSSLSDI